MKKILIGIFGLVVLALAGALVAPGFVDWSKYRPKIESAVEDATGYQVNFGGDIKLAVLPFPHVVINDLEIKTGDGKGSVITLKQAAVSIALMPLFSGEVSVSSVNLVDPVITLAVDKDGHQSWMTGKLQAKTGGNAAPATSGVASVAQTSGSKAASIALNRLDIQNGTVNYTDARSGQKIALEKINMTLGADTLAGPFRANGSFNWDGHEIDTDVQTGKLDDTAKTISVQATVKIPDSNASASYAGIVGTAGGIDVQGQVKLGSSNISGTVTKLSGNASTLPPLETSIEGVLTAKGAKASIKSLNIAYGDLVLNGSADLDDIKAENGPALAMLNLASEKPFKLENIMPGKSVRTVRAAPEDEEGDTGPATKSPASSRKFLPDTLTLPLPIDIKADVKLAGVSYQGVNYSGLKLNLDKKGGVIAVDASIAKMPGEGTLAIKSTLTYAGGSQNADKKSVIYSDPVLAFDVKVSAKSPARLLAPFVPSDTLKSAQQALADPMALTASGSVKGGRAGIDSGTLSIGQTGFDLGSSFYSLGGNGRDDVGVTVSGKDIDFDTFLGGKASVPKAAGSPSADSGATSGAAAPAAQTLQDALKKLNLPVNLALKADFRNVTLQGTAYPAIGVDGGLQGKTLTLRSASLQDATGNVMQVAGTVKNIAELTGIGLTVSGKTADANAFLKSMKVDASKLPKDIGPLDLSVAVQGDRADSLNFNAKAKVFDGQAQASGVLLNALSNAAVDKLTLSLSNPNFERLAQKFVPTYRAGVGMNKNLDIAANVNQTSGGYDISSIDASLGEMTLKGSVKIDTGGDKPDVDATFTAGAIPLDILAGKDKAAVSAATPGTSKTIQTAAVRQRWSTAPIDSTVLRAFNLSLKLNAKSIEYGSWVLGNAALDVKVKDGAMTISQFDADVYGGKMNLTANVKSAAKVGDALSFDTKADFKNVALEPMAAAFAGGSRLIKARGNVSLSMQAGSSGASPSDIVSGLSGKGQVDGKDVVLQGFDLAAMSRSLVSTTKVLDNIAGLASASFSGGETAFDTIDGPFNIEEGIVGFDKFLMTGKDATITSKGTISLPRWYVDMVSSIDLVTPEDAPNLDIKFQGSLDNPGNTFGSGAMQNYIQSRINTRLQSEIAKKIGDKNPALNSLVNGLLGVKTPPPAPPATDTAAPAQAPAAQEPAPPAAPTAEPAQKPTRQEKINNVLKGLLGQ